MSDTKFIYVRDEGKNKFPVGCFAFKTSTLRKKGQVISKVIHYGYSVYNPGDKFDKETARVIANYRLVTDPRACYSATSSHANDHLSSVMSITVLTGVHQWALQTDECKALPMRFRKACARMATHLKDAKLDINDELERLVAKQKNINDHVARLRARVAKTRTERAA